MVTVSLAVPLLLVGAFWIVRIQQREKELVRELEQAKLDSVETASPKEEPRWECPRCGARNQLHRVKCPECDYVPDETERLVDPPGMAS